MSFVVPIVLAIRYAIKRRAYPKLRETELKKVLARVNQRFEACQILWKCGTYAYWIAIDLPPYEAPNCLPKSSPSHKLDSLDSNSGQTLLSG